MARVKVPAKAQLILQVQTTKAMVAIFYHNKRWYIQGSDFEGVFQSRSTSKPEVAGQWCEDLDWECNNTVTAKCLQINDEAVKAIYNPNA